MSLGMCCVERTRNVVSSLTLHHKLQALLTLLFSRNQIALSNEPLAFALESKGTPCGER